MPHRFPVGLQSLNCGCRLSRSCIFTCIKVLIGAYVLSVLSVCQVIRICCNQYSVHYQGLSDSRDPDVERKILLREQNLLWLSCFLASVFLKRVGQFLIGFGIIPGDENKNTGHCKLFSHLKREYLLADIQDIFKGERAGNSSALGFFFLHFAWCKLYPISRPRCFLKPVEWKSTYMLLWLPADNVISGYQAIKRPPVALLLKSELTGRLCSWRLHKPGC